MKNSTAHRTIILVISFILMINSYTFIIYADNDKFSQPRSSGSINKTSTRMIVNGNDYGFTLPIDNMSIDTDVNSRFGTDYGGTDSNYSNHRGIDIIGGGNIDSIEWQTYPCDEGWCCHSYADMG